MKKLKLLYALVFAVAVIACSKDDESPSFKKEDFYATWKIDGSEDGDCVDVIKFDANKMYNGDKCGNDAADFYFENAYTFDGKQTFTVNVLGIESKMVVTSKTATTFKADSYLAGTKIETVTYTKL